MRIKSKVVTICLLVLLITIAFVCKDSVNLSAATLEDKKWSFEFSNLSVSEVLNKIRNTSGVEINLNGNMEMKSITKSYKDYTIDNILLDIFNNENLAALFNYNDKVLRSINIWILPEGKTGNIIRNYISNAPARQVTTEKHIKTPENFTRLITNNIPNFTENKGRQNIVVKKNSPFVSFKKSSDWNSKNNVEENGLDTEVIVIPPSPDTSEEVDIIPLPEIVTKLGLEPPPMPPGLSFNN